MNRSRLMWILAAALTIAIALIPEWMNGQQPQRGQGRGQQPEAQQGRGGRGGRGNNPFPGGENADGSLRPTSPVTRLFTQDAYTEYSMLAPETQSFRIRYLTETSTPGAKELVNGTRGGSEGSDIEVYEPRTGKPLKFTYEQDPNDPEAHAIHAALPWPVPEGGIGRVLIYKTYHDPRTYMKSPVNPDTDIVWVRSLGGYRLGVILPRGYSYISSNTAAQISTTADGRLKLHFANPSGISNPTTIHARKTTAQFTPARYTDMFFDDIKTLYDLGAPESHTMMVEQIYSDYRKGDKAKLDVLSYAPLQDLKVIDLDTAKPLVTSKDGNGQSAKLEVPITDDKQSAYLKVTGKLSDNSYRLENGDLVFDRTVRGLRNTVLLPVGWEVAASSQSGTVGIYKVKPTDPGRAFVAFFNLNSENQYRITIRAKKTTGARSTQQQ